MGVEMVRSGRGGAYEWFMWFWRVVMVRDD